MSFRNFRRNTRQDSWSSGFTDFARGPYFNALSDNSSEGRVEGIWGPRHEGQVQSSRHLAARSESTESSQDLPPPYQEFASNRISRSDSSGLSSIDSDLRRYWSEASRPVDNRVRGNGSGSETIRGRTQEDEAMMLMTQVYHGLQPPSALNRSEVIRQMAAASRFHISDHVPPFTMMAAVRTWHYHLYLRACERERQEQNLAQHLHHHQYGIGSQTLADDESVQTFYTARSRSLIHQARSCVGCFCSSDQRAYHHRLYLPIL